MAYPTLNSNEIFSALYNMIISQQVFADNISGTNSALLDAARTDGTLYGDTKLYYSTDCLSSAAWTNDSEAANLLTLYRPKAPECQAIVLNQFRQIRLTVDNYLSKRAWSTEGAFSEFTSVMLGWIRDTKRVYDSALYNSYIGTVEGAATVHSINADVTTAQTGMAATDVEGKNRVEVETIAQTLADLVVNMEDVSRDYNDYKQLRSYNGAELKVVWNAKFMNKMRKVDLPTIFHKDGLTDKFEQYALPERFFGTVITSTNVGSYSASTATTGKPLAGSAAPYTYTPGTNHANGCVRVLKECDVTVSAIVYHLFPGDELPAGASVAATDLGSIYINDAAVIAKVFVKLPVFMSAFEVGTSFFNPRALTETHYLTWGYSNPQYLKNYPVVTIKKA